MVFIVPVIASDRIILITFLVADVSQQSTPLMTSHKSVSFRVQ